jgi:hypothetical protein
VGSSDLGILQSLAVNVNIHVKDLAKGQTDFDTIESMTNTFVSYLPFVEPTMHAYFGRENLIRELDKLSHYQNIQLNVYLINN